MSDPVPDPPWVSVAGFWLVGLLFHTAFVAPALAGLAWFLWLPLRGITLSATTSLFVLGGIRLGRLLLRRLP